MNNGLTQSKKVEEEQMIRKLFRKPKQDAVTIPSKEATSDVPAGIMSKCPTCKHIILTKELEKQLKVCPKCHYHFRLTAYERLDQLVDRHSFEELFETLNTENPLHFPSYEEKVLKDQQRTQMKEAVVTGVGKIKSHSVAIAVMDAHFRMGSMGSVVGEKITRLIEYATKHRLPVFIFSASGGARMQEGTISLMQMAKTSVALERHDAAGLLYVSILTDPTTGGVSASFASVGDINIAEPNALIGFAGRRVIEQTVREKLPKNFQTAEFLLECGQLDDVVSRHSMRNYLATILALHKEGK